MNFLYCFTCRRWHAYIHNLDYIINARELPFGSSQGLEISFLTMQWMIALCFTSNHLDFLFWECLVIWDARVLCILSLQGNRRIPFLCIAVPLCQQARSGLGMTVLTCMLLLKNWWLLVLRSPGHLTTLRNEYPPIFFQVCWPFWHREKSLVQQNWAPLVCKGRFDWNVCFGSYGILWNLLR